MSTKYIKVAASERLPKKDGDWFHVFTEESTDICQFNGTFEAENTTVGCEVTHWLEEVPDNEDILRKENKQLLKSLKKVKRRWKNICNESDGTLKNTMVFEFGNGIESLIKKHKQ